jgi:hypothetical protein
MCWKSIKPYQLVVATDNKTLKATYDLTFYASDKEVFATIITKTSDVGNPDLPPVEARTREQHNSAVASCNFNWTCVAIECCNTIMGCEGSGGNCVHCFYEPGCK